jgi:hypothetical protein
LPSIIPETDSDSATSVEMSARRPCRREVIARRSRPTRRVSQTKNAGPGEERERKALEVLVDRDAQVVHHPLSDVGRDVGLHDAQRRGRDGDGDHPADKLAEQRQVALGERPGQHEAEQKGRDHAQGGGEDDQCDDAEQPPLVGREETQNPPALALTLWIEELRSRLARAEHPRTAPAPAPATGAVRPAEADAVTAAAVEAAHGSSLAWAVQGPARYRRDDADRQARPHRLRARAI